MTKKEIKNLLFLSPLLLILNCYISPPLPVQLQSSPPSLPVSGTPVSSAANPNQGTPDNSEKIVFMSNRSGFWDIYTMNTDGSEQLKLTNDDMKGPFAFSISPDAKKIAYISDKSGNPDLWVMDMESKETIQVTNTQLVDEGSPTWSADSENIAFHSNANQEGFYQILQVSYPIVNTQPVFKILLAESNINTLHPAYSPNGSSLLYLSTDTSGVSVLHIYDFLKKKDLILTNKDEQAINGSWSPDSNKIIYWTNGNGLFQINSDGTGKSQLGTFKNIKGTPFFSPDGSKIIVARGFGFADDFDVWMMDSDGRNPKKLTTLGGISLGWLKRAGNPVIVIPGENSPSPNPTASTSGMPYLDPNDSLINP